MTAAETGLLLLCCALPEAEDRPLTMAQVQELSRLTRALGPGGENPLRELTEHDLARLGYSQEQCGRIVRLLSRETQLERYLRAAERNGIVPITRLSPRYPARLRQTLGQRCPAVLFAKGDETPLSMRCISVVGSRELTEGGRAFAEAAGRLIARSGYALCSGGAMGADRAAQEACLTAGGDRAGCADEPDFAEADDGLRQPGDRERTGRRQHARDGILPAETGISACGDGGI